MINVLEKRLCSFDPVTGIQMYEVGIQNTDTKLGHILEKNGSRDLSNIRWDVCHNWG
jgi:hypothetical protein